MLSHKRGGIASRLVDTLLGQVGAKAEAEAAEAAVAVAEMESVESLVQLPLEDRVRISTPKSHKSIELSARVSVAPDLAITSTESKARIMMVFLSSSASRLMESPGTKASRRVATEKETGVMKRNLLKKVLHHRPLRKPRSLAAKDVRGEKSPSPNPRKLSRKWVSLMLTTFSRSRPRVLT